MKKISIIAAVLVAFIAACGSKAQVGDNGASTGGSRACTSNAQCPVPVFKDLQCGYHPCVEGACSDEYLDAGTPCITGFVDNDASAPAWGACNGSGSCL